MKNIYDDIYPNADWRYEYTCPVCNEPVPLEIDLDSPPVMRMLKGYCQNCQTDISISEDEWEQQDKENFWREEGEI